MRHEGRLTQRLRLEPVAPGGVVDLLTLHADPGVAAWNGGAWSPAQAASFAAEMSARSDQDGAGKWLAYDRDDGRLVGRGGLSYVEVLGDRRLEVGWQIRDQLWGRGFATEIGRAALDFAFSDLDADNVVAFAEVHNVRSRRVMDRLGMRYVQQFHRRGLVAGMHELQDDAVFVLYRTTRFA